MPKKSGGGAAGAAGRGGSAGAGRIQAVRLRGSGGSVSKVSSNVFRLAASVIARTRHAREGARAAKRGYGRVVYTDASYAAGSKALDANKAYQMRPRGGPYQYQGTGVTKTGKMTEHHWSRKEQTGKETFLGVGPRGQLTYRGSR